MTRKLLTGVALAALALVGMSLPATAGPPVKADDVAAYWTSARRAAAVPRDILVDAHGRSTLNTPQGRVPYGLVKPELVPGPRQIPGDDTSNLPTTASLPLAVADSTPPTISGLDPASGATIEATHTFKATVTDPVGVRSVTFLIGRSGVKATKFAAKLGANDVWSVTLTGLADGDWSWTVTAKDKAKGGGNTDTIGPLPFTVASGGGGGGVIANAEWPGTGIVQRAAGRIYFEMPANSQLTRWDGYVCSGTVVTDGASDRSIVQTAAHCVYDEAHQAFARNVLFIPNQAASGTATDLNCANDVYGCWSPTFGVVDDDWANGTWPANAPWDYGYYVVPTTGAHTPGTTPTGDELEGVTGTIGISFTAPTVGTATAAIGYSYSADPHLMYCQQGLGTNGATNWWLSQCELTGGSSGGPWLQPIEEGNGSLVSVNSWGYTSAPGMAGPKLSGTSASCVLGVARTQEINSTGVTATC